MTTITKFIIGAIITILMMSCNFQGDFGWGVTGNGEVTEEERNVSEDFDRIEVSRGLDVYLTQGDEVDVIVEADSNLHDIIMTEVENNTLYIFSEENINRSRAQKIHVTFTDLSKIESNSGSDVYSTNVIKADDIELITNSGADMEVAVQADVVECSASSGSDLRVSGRTSKLYADASSGADIKAGDLVSETCEARASSGSDITVNATSELVAKASSGADIKYYGNPEKITKKDGVSGSVRKQ